MIRQVNTLRVPYCLPKFVLEPDRFLNTESLQLKIANLWFHYYESLQAFYCLAFHITYCFLLSSENKVDFSQFNHFFIVFFKTLPTQIPSVARNVNVFFFWFWVGGMFHHQVPLLQTFKNHLSPLFVQINWHSMNKLWTLSVRGVTAISRNSFWLFQLQKSSFDQTPYFQQVCLYFIRFHYIIWSMCIVTDVKHF